MKDMGYKKRTQKDYSMNLKLSVVEKGPAGEVVPLTDATVTNHAPKTDTTLISNALGLVTVKKLLGTRF